MADFLPDMPATTAELTTIEETLQHLRPSWKHPPPDFPDPDEVVATYKLPGFSRFQKDVASSKLRADAVKAALETNNTEPPTKCVTNPSSVLASWDLLTRVLSYRDSNDWFFTAPVSRLVRAAYMSVVVEETAFAPSYGRSAVMWVCATQPAQAAHSHARLDAALRSDDFEAAARRVGRRSGSIARAAGATGDVALVRRCMALGGVQDASWTLTGAARLCNAGLLSALHALVASPENRKVGSLKWDAGMRRWGQVLAECGDGGDALTWVSQQRPPRVWPRCYTLSLCQRAAANGHLRTLQFLLGPGLALFGPLDEQLAYRAGSNSDNPGRAMEEMTMLEAAVSGGDIATVQWLLDLRIEAYDSELSERVMEIAAHRGHLPLLRWLRGKQCPFDAGTICSTVAGVPGSRCTPAVLQWMRGCGWGDWSAGGMTAMLAAALMPQRTDRWLCEDPNFTVAEYLLREGAQWPEPPRDGALLRGPWDLVGMLSVCKSDKAVLWALRHGCPWGKWGTDECNEMESRIATAKRVLHSFECPCQCPRD
ncbi:hypothetical protein JKP88DRAFT_310999 [Tribonema minus]|uniref:Uncharacterized protein n=1 Tax=Tribonema minus TaxID=303371 RepID=A0A835Z2J0_9STRA|nr:hypothetical protein JKP88DRAFT_310999 [Tribonema minus]